MANDQELPVAFWGTDPDLAEDHAADHSLPNGDPDIAGEWTESFRVLGHDFHEATSKHLNTFSALLNKQILTIEDVYRHLQAVVTLGPELVNAAEQENLKEVKRAHKEAVKAAGDEWHEACRQRKDAMKQWDAYVEAKRVAYRKIRDGS